MKIFKNPARKRARVAPDMIAARELEAWADNDDRFSPAGHGARAHRANIFRKLASGKYDHRKAWKFWLYLVDAAAQDYCKTFGRGTYFDKPTREAAAKSLSYRFMREYKLGNWNTEASAFAPKARRKNPGRRRNPDFRGKLTPKLSAAKRDLERTGFVVKIEGGNSSFVTAKGVVLRPSWTFTVLKGGKSETTTFPMGKLDDGEYAKRLVALALRLARRLGGSR